MTMTAERIAQLKEDAKAGDSLLLCRGRDFGEMIGEIEELQAKIEQLQQAMPTFTAADIKLVSLNGAMIHKIKCPGCRQWGYIDEDQFFGHAGLMCSRCGWHETCDLSEVTKIAGES
ncbi:MAG: hypothetical protein GY832_01485 [Chloroflexi bacterium]|nr:hypothetical protein [Chloroflexota bacterium]